VATTARIAAPWAGWKMPLAPLLGAALLTWLGGGRAVLVLVALTLLVALAATLSRSIRSVPRPAQWRAQLERGSVTPATEQEVVPG
jgi:hypothetical protein